MKININTIYKKKFIAISFVLVSFLFVLFNVQTTSHNNITSTQYNKYFVNECYAVDKIKTQKDISIDYKATDNPMVDAIYYVLVKILQLVAWLIGLSTTLISLSIKPEFSNVLLNSPGVKTGWGVVRDFLNIFFVFFLLFSAFATVFQVSSYHIKKTWIMIVVMALLVNFSWPVTRVIIDFSNVTMISIIGDDGDGDAPASGMMAKYSDSAKFFDLVLAKGYFNASKKEVDVTKEGSMTALLFAIGVGIFMLFTFFTVALVLLLRTLILVVMLIFAPVGYVLLAFPATKSYASSWWNMLLKQAFLGPIIIFLLYLSTMIMVDSTAGIEKAFSSTLEKQMGMKDIFAGVAPMLMAAGLFWISILAAQKMSGQTAGLALSGARKARGAATGAMKGVGKGVGASGAFVGRKIDNGTGNYVGSGIKRLKDANPLSKKNREKEKEEYEARVDARVKGGKTNRDAILENRASMKAAKELKESGTTSDQAEAKLASGEITDPGKIRAYLDLAQKGNNYGKNETNYNKLSAAIEKLSGAEKINARKKMDKAYNEGGNSQSVTKNLAKELQAKDNTLSSKAAFEKAAVQNIGSMDAKTMSKQQFWKGTDSHSQEMQKVANSRIENDFGSRQQQQFASSMSTELKLEKQAAQKKIEKKVERQTMRDMQG